MKNILLTGGAGYIGSHVANLLLDQGFNVTIIDNLITGNKKVVPKKSKLFICDISEKAKVTEIINNNSFDIVMHFAGLIRVDQSIKNPKLYDIANYKKGKIFFNTCIKNNLKNIIFSSTASIYGNNSLKKISEKNVLNPISPYAKSKLNLEKFLIKKSKTNNIKFIILRYFNVAGADKKLRTGLIAKSSTNLIKVLCEIAIGKRKSFNINGNNYETKDGTPIRDFIHVSDLAEIHLLVAKYLIKNKKSQIFNCGYGKGFSVQEVLEKMNQIIKKKISTNIGPRRDKDIMISIADTKKINKYIKWKPKFNNLDYILKTAYEWEKKLSLTF